MNPPILYLLMNAAAGSGDAEAIRATLRHVWHEAGCVVHERVAAKPSQLAALTDRTLLDVRSQGATLVAAGGDGTLNTVAQRLLNTDVPLGIIPLGTFNYFARQYAIPADPAEAAALVLTGIAQPVNVGSVNGHVYLNNASLGLYARLIEEREHAKRHLGRNRGVAALAGLVSLLGAHNTLKLNLLSDGVPHDVRTPLVFFGNNALQLRALGLPEADSAAARRLAGVVLKPVSKLAMVRLMMRGVLGKLAADADLTRFVADEVVISGRFRRIKLVLDGEIITCTAPLHFCVQKAALQIILPPAMPAESLVA